MNIKTKQFAIRHFYEVFVPVLNSHLLKVAVKKHLMKLLKLYRSGFPGGAVVKNPPANAGDTGSSPGPGRSHMPQSN